MPEPVRTAPHSALPVSGLSEALLLSRSAMSERTRSIPNAAARHLRSAVDRANPTRPEMSPQRIEKIESAPGNGAPAAGADEFIF